MADLLPYRYTARSSHNALRVVKLFPADINQEAVDCEIVETQIAKTPAEQAQNLQYEALSWYWGPPPHDDRNVLIHENNQRFKHPISSNLHSALKALRYTNEARFLWIDGISINQADIDERNHQVSVMNKIFARAKNVCIWTGIADDMTKNALKFIREKIVKVWSFDSLTKNRQYNEDWAAFKTLLTRPWFARRWVVQEIALAKNADLYCGRDWVPWKDFSVAVSLFVEVESNTHQLSDMMQRSESYNFVPEYFGYVPALGAASLVDATANLFRITRNGERQALLSLEYLISKYSVFEATQPRDTVYSFLSIASDTVPQVFGDRATPELPNSNAILKLKTWFAQKSASRAYRVDYRIPVVEVYKDFVVFAITQSLKSDPASALDIICRPWAPRYSLDSSRAGLNEVVHGTVRFIQREDVVPDMTSSQNLPSKTEPLPTWIADLQGAPFGMAEHTQAGFRMERQSADSLVGLPRHGERNYRAAGTRFIAADAFHIQHFKLTRESTGATRELFSMFVEGFILDKIEAICEPAQGGSVPASWLEHVKWDPKTTGRDIPEHFWRILVADRGPQGRNPPFYYARACQLAFGKRHARNPLNTQKLITEERSTIIADTLRRVQAVVWNKRLMSTDRSNTGLVPTNAQKGDVICILYGCSVPVLLRHNQKSLSDVDAEKKFNQDEANRVRDDRVRKVQKIWRNIVRTRSKNKNTAKVKTGEAEATNAGDAFRREEAATIRARTEVHNRPAKTIIVPETPSSANVVDSQDPAPETHAKKPADRLRNYGAYAFICRNYVALFQLLWTSVATILALLSTKWRWASFVVGAHAFKPAQFILQRSEASWNSHFSHPVRIWIASLLLLWLGATVAWMHAGIGEAIIISTVPLICFWTPSSTTTSSNVTNCGHRDVSFAATETPKTPNPPARTGLTDTDRKLAASSTAEDGSALDLPSLDAPADHVPDCYYEVIGEVYLHGMMDGEAIAWQNEQIEGNTAWKPFAMPQQFELR